MSTAQVILISGSSSGFGRLTAVTLAAQGHTVFAGLRDSSGRNAAVAQELRAHPRVHPLDLDVTDDTSVERAVQTVLDNAGRVDVVINNAGTLYVGPTEAFTAAQVQQQFDTNVFGIMRLNRAALPHMRAQGSGLLIQISSVLGRLAFPFTGVYAASKFAIEGLTEAYRSELAAFGIDAALVEPGTYPTSIGTNGSLPSDTARFAPYRAAFERFSAMMSTTAVHSDGRAADPQEVADAIAALVARPAGTRPLRTVVAVASQRGGLLTLNATADHAIVATMDALGFAPLAAPAAQASAN